MESTIREPARGSKGLRGAAVRGAVAVTAIAVLGMLTGPGSALAQDDPTADQYDPTITQIQTEAGGGGGGTPPPESVGPLPFTGLDVGALAAVAAALTLLGIVLYRRSRHLEGGDATS